MSLHQQLLRATRPLQGGGHLGVKVNRARAALRAVVELHAPFQRSTLSLGCQACSTPVHTLPGRYVTVVNWPCSTVQAMARELGIEATDHG